MKTISTCVRRKGALIATTGKIQRDVTMLDVFFANSITSGEHVFKRKQ